MFRVESFNVCPVTGVTDFEVLFNIGTGEKKDQRSYIHKEDADRYILGMKRDYILHIFSHYVNHSRILSEVGTPAFYRTQARLEALEKCRRANHYFQEIPLREICGFIIQMEKDLRMILPSPGNNSFQSSEDKLLDMVVFSKAVCQVPAAVALA